MFMDAISSGLGVLLQQDGTASVFTNFKVCRKELIYIGVGFSVK